ncbi:peptidoglycan recognition protein family protein, partial [Cellulomonas pakistanensis]|uniref:peptidoglycan recognition protein family protein n=1 Tax=Cellulomonas pakistanensis TaxID=992287 RepID=UPI001945B16B
MLRSLIVLVTSAGLGLAPASIPSPTAPATTLVAAASAVAAAVDDTVAADVTVVDVPLVVVPLADAEAEAEADAGTARAPEAAGAEPAPTPGPGPTAEPGPTPAPAESVTSDGPVAADVLVDGDRVVTPAVEVADAQTVGITWPEGTGGAQLAPELRFRADGGWSEWVALGVADAEPDAGTADAVRAERGGTDSYWIGDADAVQLSFAATRSGGPADISLALVGSPEADAAPAATGAGDGAVIRNAVRSTGEATVLAAATRPSIVTRGQWGARPQVCAPDVAARLSGAVVHHTAGSNAYSTQAQAMQQIRNDQAYHIDARGWCDIGYNFVVDKWGNIYEGRANSLTQAVIGVHASGANTGTVGVSMLGNYDTVATTPAMIGAVGRIIGWRLGNYGIDPHGSGTYPSGLTLPRVIGHRDVTSTACPGRYGYAQLPNIRNIAAANLGDPPYP